jgi:undecaprenyl-diphosphatase
MMWLQTLVEWDKWLFHLVNTGLSNPIFDAILPWMREKWFWAPAYLFVLTFGLLNIRKRVIWFVLGWVLVVVAADGVSSKLIKPAVQRVRPCNDTEMQVVQRVPCGSGYSFTSSHACNHFAVAVYLLFVFAGVGPWVRPTLLTWAAVISFSQVYVGVHYPVDILVGAIIGSVIGMLIYRLIGGRTGFELGKIGVIV